MDLLIRFNSDFLNKIDSHNEVYENYQTSYFGKVGRGLGIKNLNLLNNHLAKNNKVNLYLLATKNKVQHLFITEIKHLSTEKPDNAYLPDFYKNIPPVGLWIKINRIEKISAEELKKLKCLSSGKNVEDSLKGMTTFFLIE